MEDLSLLLDKSKAAFMDTEDYRILLSYRTRDNRLSFDERQSIIKNLDIIFSQVFKRLKTDSPSLTESDLLYCALSAVGIETIAIAECLTVTADAVRMRKCRLREKLSATCYVTFFGEAKRNNIQSVTQQTEEPHFTELTLLPDSKQKQKAMKTGMNFGMAVSQCYRKCFTYNGRARRAEFWYFFLFATIILNSYWVVHYLMTSSLIPVVSESTATIIRGIDVLLHWIAELSIIIPMLAVIVRRLHDRGMPGWISILIYLFPNLIYSLFCYLQNKHWDEIKEALEYQFDALIAFIIAYLIIILLVLSTFIVRIIMMSKRGDVGPNDYGADPIEVYEPNGTGFAVLKDKQLIACLVLIIIGTWGVFTLFSKDQARTNIDSDNMSEQQAIEIVKSMEEFIENHNMVGVQYTSQLSCPIMIDGKIISKDDENYFKRDTVIIKPYNGTGNSNPPVLFSNFRHILPNYDVIKIEDESDEYWIVQCQKSYAKWLKNSYDELRLEIKKDSYQPLNLTAHFGGITYKIEDIVFGENSQVSLIN